MAKKYVECLKCGTIHYTINKEEAASLKAGGRLVEEFSARNLTYCFNCGSKTKFSEVTNEYVNDFASGDHIQPIFLDNGELKPTTKEP